MERKLVERVNCECGRENIHPSGIRGHRVSNAHLLLESMQAGAVTERTSVSPAPTASPAPANPIDPDEQAILDAYHDGPVMQAKMTRALFSARRWPNKERPGTVRDWLGGHHIPVIDTPKGFTDGEMRAYVRDRQREAREAQEVLSG